MRRLGKILRKAGVLIIGVPLLVIGLILIPLPGPGVIITIAALFILSLEFDGVKPYLGKAIAKIQVLIDKFQEEYKKLS